MIIERFRHGVKRQAYKITRPRSLRTTVNKEMMRAKHVNYTASCEFENECMNGNAGAAHIVRHRDLVMWIRKQGQYNMLHLPRPKRKNAA
jgi:hypothetical protein